MTRYEVLPNILWKVDNLWNTEKVCSGVVSFLGMNFKLKLQFLPESCGVKLKLILKRLGAATLSQDTNFSVETSLMKQYGTGEYYKQSLSASLNYKEWCIWSQLKTDVEKQDSVNYRNSIVFLVVITPGDKWLAMLQSTYKKKAAVPEVPPCLKCLSSDLDQLLDSDAHSDVVLSSACGRQFRAHRAILSARSPVFAAMLRSDMRESREGVVTVSDAEPEVLELFLRYLYSGAVDDLSADAARKLHALADRYGVDALRARCTLAVADSYRSGAETKLPKTRDHPVTYITEAQGVELRKKGLTKELLMSKEWKSLSAEFPQLVADMCSPLMVPVPLLPDEEEEEKPPAEGEEEKKADAAAVPE